MDKSINVVAVSSGRNPMNQIADSQSYFSNTGLREATEIASFEEALDNIRAKRNAENSVERQLDLESGTCATDQFMGYSKTKDPENREIHHGHDSCAEQLVADNTIVLPGPSERVNDVNPSTCAKSQGVVDGNIVLAAGGEKPNAEYAEPRTENSLSDFVNSVMQRINEAPENNTGKWTFEVVERFHNMSDLQLERSELGVWRIQIGLGASDTAKHEQAENQISAEISALVSALKSQGHEVESVSFNAILAS